MTRWPATTIRTTTVINRNPPMRLVPVRLPLLSDRTQSTQAGLSNGRSASRALQVETEKDRCVQRELERRSTVSGSIGPRPCGAGT